MNFILQKKSCKFDLSLKKGGWWKVKLGERVLDRERENRQKKSIRERERKRERVSEREEREI